MHTKTQTVCPTALDNFHAQTIFSDRNHRWQSPPTHILSDNRRHFSHGGNFYTRNITHSTVESMISQTKKQFIFFLSLSIRQVIVKKEKKENSNKNGLPVNEKMFNVKSLINSFTCGLAPLAKQRMNGAIRQVLYRPSLAFGNPSI